MALVSDSSHYEKLKKLNINIKTKYIVGNSILEKNTDGSHNDDIKNGIRCMKSYYINGHCCHIEKIFDSRVEYTYVSDIKNKEYTCLNCGMTSSLDNFNSGCPFCRTNYNIDYVDKDLGSKYHYDLVLRNNIYKFITALVDVFISLILSFIFIKFTSRTFNSYDISKVILYGTILALILYYFFYIIDGYVILEPIKVYKNRKNLKQIAFWNRTKIDKKTFFNNFNYEIQNMYYKYSNIIDYDIIDFLEFNEYTKNNNLYVDVKVLVRIVTFDNNKISSKFVKKKYVLKKNTNKLLKLTEGLNFIKCPNCGASLDVTKKNCDFCHASIDCIQEWILEN